MTNRELQEMLSRVRVALNNANLDDEAELSALRDELNTSVWSQSQLSPPQLKPKTGAQMTTDFMRGFRQATGLNDIEAGEQWAAFSRQLSNAERDAIEAGGYDSGLAMGAEFRKMFPGVEGAQ